MEIKQVGGGGGGGGRRRGGGSCCGRHNSLGYVLRSTLLLSEAAISSDRGCKHGKATRLASPFASFLLAWWMLAVPLNSSSAAMVPAGLQIIGLAATLALLLVPAAGQSALAAKRARVGCGRRCLCHAELPPPPRAAALGISQAHPPPCRRLRSPTMWSFQLV